MMIITLIKRTATPGKVFKAFVEVTKHATLLSPYMQRCHRHIRADRTAIVTQKFYLSFHFQKKEWLLFNFYFYY